MKMHRDCLIVLQLGLLLGISLSTVLAEPTGVRFCHEEKVNVLNGMGHFNASTGVIRDVIKDANVGGDFTCSCFIIAEQDIQFVYVWSKIAVTSTKCNKRINVDVENDDLTLNATGPVTFSGCEASPKKSLPHIRAGQVIRLVLKTSVEHLHGDDDHVIYIVPEPDAKLSLYCQLPEPIVEFSLTTEAVDPTDASAPFPDVTAIVTTSTVPNVPTSNKKAVVIGVAVTVSLLVFVVIFCLAFFVARRFRQKHQQKNDEVKVGARTGENSGLSRKMTTFYNKIRLSRPLPSIPKSIRRLRQRPLPRELRELRQSGIYNSIKETPHYVETNDSSFHLNTLNTPKRDLDARDCSADAINSYSRLQLHSFALNKNRQKKLIVTSQLATVAKEAGGREKTDVEPACYITPVGESSGVSMEDKCYVKKVNEVETVLEKCEQNHLHTLDVGVLVEDLNPDTAGQLRPLERPCTDSGFAEISLQINGCFREDLHDESVYVHPSKVTRGDKRESSSEKVYENLSLEKEEQNDGIVKTDNTSVQDMSAKDGNHVVKQPVVTVDSCGYVPMGKMNRGVNTLRNSASANTNCLMLMVPSGHCNSESDTCYSDADDDFNCSYANTSIENLVTGSKVSVSDTLSVPARKSKQLDFGYLSDSLKSPQIGSMTADDLFPNMIQFRGFDVSVKRPAPVANTDGNHGNGKVKVKRYVKPKTKQTQGKA